MREKKIRKLDPKNKTHAAFAERVASLEFQDLVDMFNKPKKPKRGQDLCNEFSALAVPIFSGIKLPLSDEDLKEILRAAYEISRSAFMLNQPTLEINVSLTGGKPTPYLFMDYRNPICKSYREEEGYVQRLESSRRTNSNKDRPREKGVGIAEIRPRPKHPNVENMRYENILPIVDAVEKPALDLVKNHGYTKVEKSETARRFIKDDGNYFDVFKNGSMRSKPQSCEGDPEEVAKKFAQQFIAMISVYHEVAKQYGKELAFPSGILDLAIKGPNLNSEVNKLAKMYVGRELAKPPLDWIGEKFSYDGEVLKKAEERSLATRSTFFSDQNVEKKTQKTKVPEVLPPLSQVGPRPDGRRGGVNTENGDDLRKQVLKQAHARRTLK